VDAKRKAKAQPTSISSYMSLEKSQSQNFSKSMSSMLCKTSEEVVQERHNANSSQPTIEHCTKKSREVKQLVDDHVVDFL
jgi:protein subunit release factor A